MQEDIPSQLGTNPQRGCNPTKSHWNDTIVPYTYSPHVALPQKLPQHLAWLQPHTKCDAPVQVYLEFCWNQTDLPLPHPIISPIWYNLKSIEVTARPNKKRISQVEHHVSTPRKPDKQCLLYFFINLFTYTSLIHSSQYQLVPQLDAGWSLLPEHNRAYHQTGSIMPTRTFLPHQVSQDKYTMDPQHTGSKQLVLGGLEYKFVPWGQHLKTQYNPMHHHQNNTKKSRSHPAH